MTLSDVGDTVIEYTNNETKLSIRNNTPIDTVLHVIAVVSNPCHYKRRIHLAREFMNRMNQETCVKVHLIELVYGNDKFELNGNKLRTTEHPIWVKESLINFAVRNILPSDWKAVAWIDADVEFESDTWALDTLRILNGSKDIVQLFSHAVDMNHIEETMKIFTGFGYQYTKKRRYTDASSWHPGFAWACTRQCFEKMGGLYDLSILGAGDHNMALSLAGLSHKSVNKDVSDGYKKSVAEFGERCKGMRLGYVPGVIRHYFHGSKAKRGYGTRWNILVRHKYDPYEDTYRDQNGLVCISNTDLAHDIALYFSSRDEDEFLCV